MNSSQRKSKQFLIKQQKPSSSRHAPRSSMTNYQFNFNNYSNCQDKPKTCNSHNYKNNMLINIQVMLSDFQIKTKIQNKTQDFNIRIHSDKHRMPPKVIDKEEPVS